MEQDLFKLLLTNTYTQTGLKKLLKDLEFYLNQHLFTTDSEAVPPIQSPILDTITPQNLETLLHSLKKLVDETPVLIINLPIDLPEKEVDKIGRNLRVTYPNLLVEVKIDPSLIAGCSLIYKGVVKDYSVKQKIEEQKLQLIASFKSYLR